MSSLRSQSIIIMSVTVKGMFSYLKERGVIKDHNDETNEPLSNEHVEENISNSKWLRRRKPTREMIDRLRRGRCVREHAPVRGESVRTEIMSASMDSILEYDSSTASEDGANTSNISNDVAVQYGLNEDVEMEDAGDVEGNQLLRNKGDIQITRPNTSASMDSIQECQSNSTDDNDSVEPMEIDEDNENEHEMVQNDVVPQIDENNANRKKKNVLPPCPALCKKKCTEKIIKDQREGINQEYWMLSKEQQRVWLLSYAEATVPKRTNPNATNPRKHTYTYSLMSEDYGNVQVCRSFFLTTLGFKSTSNCVITWLFKLIAEQGTGVYAPKDGRGRHGNHAHKLSDEKKKVIKDHIMSTIHAFHIIVGNMHQTDFT
ncbi:uncharacterized protein LOC117122792 [Anneissia japonica]|uniref:uncharacterized protein LOC117122792 n=1 Tax=Anneissia japonica TaxID=1529436 RepID=UPI0014257C60|nr:uncharacterized protein LOC117122792 [Anneissia japonica]